MSICLRILMLVSLLTAPLISANPAPAPSLGSLTGLGGLIGLQGLQGLGNLQGLGLGVTGLPLTSMITGHGVTGLAGGAIANLIALSQNLNNDLSRRQRLALQVQIANLISAVRMQQMRAMNGVRGIALNRD